MSGRKPSSGKITLGMLKGKSIATSVPSFAIRFHTGGEELEEIYPSAEETDDEAEKGEDDLSSAGPASEATSLNELLPSTTTSIAAVTTSTVSITGLTSASATTASSRDPSPMKEYLKGLGKRSTSMDAGIIDIGTFGTSGSDTWRIFHELKGKITKTVEEKFSEMKSDRKSSSSLLSSGQDLSRGGRLGAGGKSKENSSISDSEDVSESSSKLPKEEETSPKKSSVSKEEKQSVSFEEKEKDDVLSDSLVDTPGTSNDVETSDIVEISSQGLIKRTNFRSKMKHNFSNLRQRHKANSNKTSLASGVTMSSLSALNNEDETTLDDSDIEPAVEASEDTRFAVDQPESLLIDPDIPTIDYRTAIPTAHPILDVRRRRIRRARSILSSILSYKYYIVAIFVLFVHLIFPIPSSVTGFMIGSVCVTIYFTLRDTYRRYFPDMKTSNAGRMNIQMTHFTDGPILEVPAVKEYQPLTKYAGWMNEYLEEYEPESYTINDTQSVYVRLEGAILRVSHTRLKIPKRAMWNERKHKLKFTHQRIYNIAKCHIKLLPDGLARKRLWSKKYPICIVLMRYSKCGIEYIKHDTAEDEPEPSEIENFEGEASAENIGPELTSEENKGYFLLTEPSRTGSPAETKKKTFYNGSLQLDRDDIPISDENFIDDDEELSQQDDFSDDDTFCHIDKTAMEENCLFLFARTDREKEDWYRRFVAAAKYNHIAEEDPVESTTPKIFSRPLSKVASASSITTQMSDIQQGESDEPVDEMKITPQELEDNDLEYLKFMSRFQLQVLTQSGPRVLQSHIHSFQSHGREKSSRRQEKLEAEIQTAADKEISSEVMWFNALAGRILFDVLRNPYWVVKLQERIQKKLSAIKLPYFMEELAVTELEVGNTVPLVHRASRPMLDQCGLWIDLDVTYKGLVILTLETKLNLMKLKRVGGEQRPSSTPVTKDTLSPTEKRGSPMFNSDVDDTAESSDDDSDMNKSSSEEEPLPSTSTAAGGGTGKKILRMVNKIAASKYFQHAAEYKYIKRAMEEVSNTKIMLTVEVRGLDGTLSVNIPPHPSDRLWYGFRGNPRLLLSARPKFGERQVNITHVISWIEKKLIQEFQKKFVLPNMDDLVIPPMTTHLP